MTVVLDKPVAIALEPRGAGRVYGRNDPLTVLEPLSPAIPDPARFPRISLKRSFLGDMHWIENFSLYLPIHLSKLSLETFSPISYS
jgi:hypothetical protein